MRMQLIGGAAALLLALPAAQAQTNKCVDDQGKITYQADPCTTGKSAPIKQPYVSAPAPKRKGKYGGGGNSSDPANPAAAPKERCARAAWLIDEQRRVLPTLHDPEYARMQREIRDAETAYQHDCRG
jgi:hypothetical protein